MSLSGPERGTARRVLVLLSVLLASLLAAELGQRFRDWSRIREARARNPGAAKSYDDNVMEGTPRLTLDLILGPTARVPAPVVPPPGQRGPRRWTTWEQFPADGFSGQGQVPPKRDGVFRITFHGGSTTWDGYPNRVQRLLDERFGPGRVEALNLGVPSANTNVSLLLFERFGEAWSPDIAVFQEGPNDLMYAKNRFAFTLRLAGGRLPGTRPPPEVRGLAGWLDAQPWRAPSSFERLAAQSLPELSLDAYWRLSRLTRARGTRMVVSTFPHPDLDATTPEERAAYDAELAILYPPLGTFETYVRDADRYNDALRAFARASDTPLVEVAVGLRGGTSTFADYCHTTGPGKDRHARLVFEALVPLIEQRLAGGAPSVPVGATTAPFVLELRGGEASSSNGACARGPCPEGACFIAGGPSQLGESDTQREAAVERHRAAWGLAPPDGFETWGPARRVELSPFCIDRTEVTARDWQRCVEAGACAPHTLAPSSNAEAGEIPAIVPSVEDARLLCAFRGGRLPTDAEWERAARGPDGIDGPAGPGERSCDAACLSKVADGDAENAGRAWPVGAGRPGPAGLLDARGNLWEWTDDCHRRDRAAAMSDGLRDPYTPWIAGCRGSLRGGSFRSADVGGVERRASQEGLLDAAVETRGVRCAYGRPANPSVIDPVGAADALPQRTRLGH